MKTENTDTTNSTEKTSLEQQLVERGTALFQQNKDEIQKQLKDVIAFYSLANKTPFFYVTPAEARLAIDYIKQRRGNFSKFKFQDGVITDIIKQGLLPVKKIPEGGIRSEILGVTYLVNEQRTVCDSDFLTVSELLGCFGQIEKQDMLVSDLVLNSVLFGTIRSWGNEVWNQATPKEILRDKLVGHIFTSDIRIDNKLQDNEFWLAASKIEEAAVASESLPATLYFYKFILKKQLD